MKALPPPMARALAVLLVADLVLLVVLLSRPRPPEAAAAVGAAAALAPAPDCEPSIDAPREAIVVEVCPGGPGEVSLDVGTPLARRHLGDGWSIDEVTEGRRAVWSLGPRSVIDLHLDPAGRDYRLGIVARAATSAETPARTVEVFIDGQPVGALRFEETWRAHELDLPAARLRAGRLRLELRPREPVVPSLDSRPLALFVDRLWLVPQHRP